jgi:hypothetical protein
MTRLVTVQSFVLAVIISLATAVASSAEEKTTVVRPQDTGAALVNPGIGWVLHHYDNSPFNYGGKLEASDTVDDFPGVSVVYLRIAWSCLEPQEGQFNWSVLDTPAQRWLDKGKQIALRITCGEGSPRYATPEWVRLAGAKGYFFTGGKGIDPNGRAWEPDYDDPVFLEKLDHFLAALAARYDGNPKGGIAAVFVDEGVNMRDLPTADPGKATPKDHKATFNLPLASDERTRLLKPGEYEVYISVGAPTGTPKIALPLPADDAHRRYRLGKLKVSRPFQE